MSEHVDAIGMILQSIDWSAVRMSATSPAGERLLVDGRSPKRLRIVVSITVHYDPDGDPTTEPVSSAVAVES